MAQKGRLRREGAGADGQTIDGEAVQDFILAGLEELENIAGMERFLLERRKIEEDFSCSGSSLTL